MADVQTRIDRAMRLIGQTSAGESPTATETANGLVTLNAMLDSWRNDRLLCFAFQTESLTLASADASYTIGSSGDLNTTRPVEIVEAYIVEDDQSYMLAPMNEAEYAAIFDKTTAADWPTHYLFRPSIASSQATLIVYPVPNAARTLNLTTRVVVAAFAAATDTVTLPPGWEEAIDTNLAIALAPEYGTEASNTVKRAAALALGGIKRTNAQAQPRELRTQLGMMFGAGNAYILTDEAR